MLLNENKNQKDLDNFESPIFTLCDEVAKLGKASYNPGLWLIL